eukprot:scaffold83852_cov39-Phaeocystis_antarctica.AAC.1
MLLALGPAPERALAVADHLEWRLPAVNHQPARAPVRLAWCRLPAVADRLGRRLPAVGHQPERAPVRLA